MPGMWFELERIFAEEGVTIGHSESFPSVLTVHSLSIKIRALLIILVMRPGAPTTMRRRIENSRSMLACNSTLQKYVASLPTDL